MYLNLKFILPLVLNAGMASSAHIDEKRAGGIGAAIAATIKGILGDINGFTACPEWANTTEQDVYYTGGQSSDGSIIVRDSIPEPGSIC